MIKRTAVSLILITSLADRVKAAETRCENIFETAAVESAARAADDHANLLLRNLARLQLRMDQLDSPGQQGLRATLASDFRSKRAQAIAAGVSFASFDQLLRQERTHELQQRTDQKNRAERARDNENDYIAWRQINSFQAPPTNEFDFSATDDGKTAMGRSVFGDCWTLDLQDSSARVHTLKARRGLKSARMNFDGSQVAVITALGELEVWDIRLEPG